MLTAEEIRTYEIRKGPMGGYKAEDVEELLEAAARAIETLTAQNEESIAKIGVLAQKIEEYRNDEASIHSALLKAQKIGDQILRDSKAESELKISEAEKKANETINAANFKAETILSEAQANADELSAVSKKKAEELLRKATETYEQQTQQAKLIADAKIADAESRSERMIEGAKVSVEKQQVLFDHIKGEVAIFRNHMLELYRQHMDKIHQIPNAINVSPKDIETIISSEPPKYTPRAPEIVAEDIKEAAPEAIEPEMSKIAASIEPETIETETAVAPEALQEVADNIQEEPQEASDASFGGFDENVEGEVTFGGVIEAQEEIAAEEEKEKAEEKPLIGGFKIMVDEDEEDDDDRQSVLTFGNEESRGGFTFKK